MAIVLMRAALTIGVMLGLVGVSAASAAAAAAGEAPRHAVTLTPGVMPTDGPFGAQGGGYRPGRGLPPRLSAEEQRVLADRADGRPTDDAVANRAAAKLRQGEKYAGTRNKQKRAGNHKNTGREPGGAGQSGKAASIGAAVGIGGMAWWLAKLASPACGPAAPICAVAF
jgi:hypothetical protein